MIEIRIRAYGTKIESSYDIDEEVKLADIGLCICELEKMKYRLVDESENCPPDISINGAGK